MAEKDEPIDSSMCTICLGAFQKPRTLPCSHSFCELCLSEHIVTTVAQQGQISYNCPVCRYTVEIQDPTEEKSNWVSFLPLKPSTELIQENKQQQCHPCERLKRSVNAQIWCRDCSEALCQNCYQVHNSFKIMSNHQAVLIENAENSSNVAIMPKLNIVNCTSHNDKRVEMYCSVHCAALCIQCLFENHRHCDDVKIIDQTENTKEMNKKSYESLLTKLNGAITVLIEEKRKHKAEISTKFASLEAQVLQIVTQFKMKLDDLYIEFMKMSGIKQDELQNELDYALKELSEYSSVLNEEVQVMKRVNFFGSKVQIYLYAKEMEAKITNTIKNIEKLFQEDKFQSVEANFTGILQTFENLKVLDEIKISREDSRTFFKDTMHNLNLDYTLYIGEPDFPTVGLNFVSFWSCEKLFTGKSCNPIDNDICAVLFINSLALVNTSSNEIIDSMSIDLDSKKMCFDMHRKSLYCTGCGRNGFHCRVEKNKLKNPQNVEFSSMVCGVDVFDGTIYVINDGAILESDFFKNWSIWLRASVNGWADDIAIDRVSKRFSLLTNKRHVRFGSVADKRFQETTTCQNFNNAVGITFGPSGVLFVAEQGGSIHVISNDEKCTKTLLTQLHRIRNVNDISVSHDNKKLYVCGSEGLEIYKIDRS